MKFRKQLEKETVGRGLSVLMSTEKWMPGPAQHPGKTENLRWKRGRMYLQSMGLWI